MSSIPRTSEALFAYDKLTAKWSLLNKKLESISHQLTVEENAFELRRKPITEDTGYNYYVRTRDNTIGNISILCQEIAAKINTLEAKRESAIKAINEEYDRKIEVLERKRDTEKAALDAKAVQHQKDVESVVQKYECAKPTSTAYTKLVSNKEQTQKEVDDASAELQQALVALMAAQRRDSENRVSEEKQRLIREEREQFLRDEQERKRIEQNRENDRKAEMERARQRSEAAKLKAAQTVTTIEESTLQFAFTPPPKKVTITDKKLSSCVLDPKKLYTVDELDTIEVDYDRDDPRLIELYDKLRHEASVREGAYGTAWECKEDSL